MSAGPPLTRAQVHEVREAARRQGPRLAGPLMAVAGAVFAGVLVTAFVVLDYLFDQDPHRLVKILMGVAAFCVILAIPGFGLLLIPVVTPFLPWLPVIPVPAMNPQNILLMSVFLTYAVQKVMRREPVLRHGALDGIIGLLILLIALSVVRGAAVPTGYTYDAYQASQMAFRAAMTFSTYFITLAMARGARDRRRIAWAIVIALLAESVVTMVYGRSGRGGRAVGSFGQSNELGAYLAMFTAFTAALVLGVRNLFARLVLAGTVVCGTIAVLFSVSRGAMIALVVALGFVALRSSRVLTAILVLALVTSPLWTPDYVKERVTGSEVEVQGTDETRLEGSAQLRIDTWKAITTVVTQHPIDGVGFTGLADVLPETGDELGLEVKDSAHNTYMRMLGELGVFGLLLFVWFQWRCIKLGLDGMRAARDRFDRQLSLGVTAASMAMAVSCAFGDRFFSILITGNLWMAAALVSDILLERKEAAA